MRIACSVCGNEVPQSRYGHTGTLCPDCLEGLREDHAEAIAEYRRERPDDDLDLPDPDDDTQGKREDQVDFSAGVFIGAALIAFLIVGVSIGVAIATATAPLP